MISALPPDCAQRFRHVRALAAGSFGSVHLAEQIGLKRLAAVKLLHGEVLMKTPAEVQRFANEARVTASLGHPNVVRVYDSGTEYEPWIAYEYLPGGTLRGLVEKRLLDWRGAVDAVMQVAAALEAAHAVGVIHRDIKTPNVLCAEEGRYKVTDFGIAKFEAAPALTATGLLMGSPLYLAPEVIAGEPHREASDIYATGVVLYEVLTGEHPFMAHDLMKLLKLQIHEPPPSPRAKAPAVPAELDALVLACMAKQPHHRPRSAAELRARLEATLANGTGQARLSRRTGAQATQPIAAPAGAATQQLPAPPATTLAGSGPRRGPRMAIAAVAIAVAGAALVARELRTAPASASPAASAPAQTGSADQLVERLARDVRALGGPNGSPGTALESLRVLLPALTAATPRPVQLAALRAIDELALHVAAHGGDKAGLRMVQVVRHWPPSQARERWCLPELVLSRALASDHRSRWREVAQEALDCLANSGAGEADPYVWLARLDRCEACESLGHPEEVIELSSRLVAAPAPPGTEDRAGRATAVAARVLFAGVRALHDDIDAAVAGKRADSLERALSDESEEVRIARVLQSAGQRAALAVRAAQLARLALATVRAAASRQVSRETEHALADGLGELPRSAGITGAAEGVVALRAEVVRWSSARPGDWAPLSVRCRWAHDQRDRPARLALAREQVRVLEPVVARADATPADRYAWLEALLQLRGAAADAGDETMAADALRRLAAAPRPAVESGPLERRYRQLLALVDGALAAPR